MTNGSRERSLHVLVGFACQNDCVFCCDGGFGRFQRVDTGDEVRRVLERNAALEVVEFTQHEPTLNPRLVQYVAWARELGFRIISVVTNGRTLGRGTLLERLVDSGLNRVRISLHGDRADVHDALTRRVGSFDQAIAGIRAATQMRKQRSLFVSLHSTVTALNIDRLPQMIPFVLAFSPDHHGLNAVFPADPTGDDAAVYAVEYSRIVEVLRACLRDQPLLPVTLSEIPPCQVVGRLPRAHLGLREDFHLAATPAESADAVSAGGRPGFAFGPRCGKCAARAMCDGIPARYVERFGWDAFRPVQRGAWPDSDGESRMRRLLTAPDGRWLVRDLWIRGAETHARVVAGGVELDLIVCGRDERRPAFRRTARHDVSLKGKTYGRAHIRLAEEVIANLERLEDGGPDAHRPPSPAPPRSQGRL